MRRIVPSVLVVCAAIHLAGVWAWVQAPDGGAVASPGITNVNLNGLRHRAGLPKRGDSPARLSRSGHAAGRRGGGGGPGRRGLSDRAVRAAALGGSAFPRCRDRTKRPTAWCIRLKAWAQPRQFHDRRRSGRRPSRCVPTRTGDRSFCRARSRTARRRGAAGDLSRAARPGRGRRAGPDDPQDLRFRLGAVSRVGCRRGRPVVCREQLDSRAQVGRHVLDDVGALAGSGRAATAGSACFRGDGDGTRTRPRSSNLRQATGRLRLLCVHPAEIPPGGTWSSGEWVLTPHR